LIMTIKKLETLVGKHLTQLKALIQIKKALPRHETGRFIFDTLRSVRALLLSTKQESDVTLWHQCKAMCKELVRRDKFSPDVFMLDAIQNVTEEVAVKDLSRYHNFLVSGKIEHKHQEPQILGETDLVCFVDKPSGFLCQFGGDTQDAPRISGGVHGATELLNGATSRIQLHEYIAKRMTTEVARATQEFWKTGKTTTECTCQSCPTCCTYIAGLCHRLDCETSEFVVRRSWEFSKTFERMNCKKGWARKFTLPTLPSVCP